MPRIFVSAVASEFGSLRLDVADLLERLGFEPLLHDVTAIDSNDQRPQLREQIDGCDGLLQIVGVDYGPEPPTIDLAFGPVSYAQFEYRYADKRGKKTWVILTPPGCAENRNQNGAEQGKLQEAYRAGLQQAGQVWREVADETELGLAIERLTDERASLRRPFRPWPTIGRRQAVALVLLAAICGVSWLALRWQNNRTVARELASIDTKRIRAQLELAIDESYKREISSANQLREPPQRRNELVNADRRRREKRADFDSVLELVTGTITAGHASPEFLEMSHILQERGVDAALACLTPYEGQLLDRARAGAAKQERGLRRTLSPLLLGIPLLRAQGDLAEAQRFSEKLLAAEPDWLLAQEQYVVTLMQRGEAALAENRVMTAWTRFAAARTSAEQLLKQDPRNRLVEGELAAAYLRLGDLARQSIEWKEANEFFDMGLAIAKQRAAADPLDREAQRAFLDACGKTAVSRLCLSYYAEAADAFKEGNQLAKTLAAADQDEALQEELADWYERIGKEFQQYRRARPEAYAASIEIRTKLAAAHPQDVPAQRKLAAAYENRASVEHGVSPFFLKSLEIRKRLAAGAPQQSEVQHDLAVLYETMGTQATFELYAVPLGQRAVLIQQAREFYKHSLEIAKQLAAVRPADGARQHDVAVCYEKLANFSQQLDQSEEAREYRQKQVEILEKRAAADPVNADSQLELAAGYSELARLNWMAGLLDQARESFQHALEIYSRRAVADPTDPAAVSHVDQSCANLAGLARSQGDLDTAEKICQRGVALLTLLGVEPPTKRYRGPVSMPALSSELRECEQGRLLVGPLDLVLKQPQNQMPWLLESRMHLLAARRNTNGVAETADALARLEPKTAWNLFRAAQGYAICAKLASGWPGYGPFPPRGTAGKSPTEIKLHTDADTQNYVRGAVALLQATVKAGFKSVASARNQPEFAALRDVPEFKELVGEGP
jgi:tetratricopeptide (TPR) repeat protein